MQNRIRAAVVGYGNIGKYVLESLKTASDFEIAGVVRREITNTSNELSDYKVVTSISELDNVDVAILSTPTRSVENYAIECLKLGINTVDSFDIHNKILPLRESLTPVAKKHNSVSIIAAR